MNKRRSRHRFKQIPNVEPATPSVSHLSVTSLQNPASVSPTQPLSPRICVTRDNQALVNESKSDEERPTPEDAPESTHIADINVYEDERLNSDDSFLYVNGTAFSSEIFSSNDTDHNSGEQNNSSSLLTETPAGIAAVKLRNWQALWVIIMTNGNRKMTKNDYQSMRTVADAFGRMGQVSWNASGQGSKKTEYSKQRITSLPHFETVHRKIKPTVLKHLAPRGKDFMVNVDLRKAGARFAANSPEGNPQTPVRVIFPSEYARADMATGPVFHHICSTSLENVYSPRLQDVRPSISVSDCVDVWPIVAAKSWFYGLPRRISVDKDISSRNSKSSFAEKNDVVRVSLIGSEVLTETARRNFEVRESGDEDVQVQGTISHVWTVHHQTRKNVPGFEQGDVPRLSDREKEVVKNLSFITYSSPSDAVKY